MAPPKRPWFRVYAELIWDRKIRRLSINARWLFVALLACARQSPIPGFLLLDEQTPMEVEDIADAASMKQRDVAEALKALSGRGLIERDAMLDCWVIPRWNERQFESDETTKRTTKHRSKEHQRNVPSSPDETPPETEADTHTEAEKPLAPQASRKRDLLFEAVTEVCKINPGELTNTARGAVNTALKSLREVGASPAAVRHRADNWASVYPDTTLTPTALAKHWPMLAQARTPSPRRDRFVEMGRSLQDRMNRVGEEGANGQPSGIADEARRSLPEG